MEMAVTQGSLLVTWSNFALRIKTYIFNPAYTADWANARRGQLNEKPVKLVAHLQCKQLTDGGAEV